MKVILLACSFLSRVNWAGFSALDNQEFLVIEGSGGGADAGS